MFVFSRKNIQIQYRPENKTKQIIDLVSRQMALERDPGLGYTLYTISEFNIYLPAHCGSQEDHSSSILYVQQGGRRQQATATRFAAFKAQDW